MDLLFYLLIVLDTFGNYSKLYVSIVFIIFCKAKSKYIIPMRLYLTMLLVVFMVNLAMAQQIRLTSYTIDNGLPTDVAKTICIDKQGFIWIGTDDGIVRFDGKKTSAYKNLLSSNYIKSFCKTKDGRLIVASDRGVSEISIFNDSVSFKTLISGNEKLNQISASTINFPKKLFEDSQGNVWISDYYGVSKLSKDGFKKYQFTEDNFTTAFARSFSFAEDGWGRLWITSFSGNLFLYDKKTDQFKQVSKSVRFNAVSDLIFLSKNKLLAGCAEGLYEINLENNSSNVYIRQIGRLDEISSLLLYKTGDVFVGTWDTGVHLLRFSDSNFSISKIDNFPDIAVNQIYNDSNSDDIWVCTNDGITLLQNSFFKALKITQNYSDFIQSITQSNDSSYYLSSGQQLYKVKKNQNHEYVSELFLRWNKAGFAARLQAGKHGLWIGSSTGIIYYYDFAKAKLIQVSNENIGRYCLFLALDKGDNLWAVMDEFIGIIKITPDFKIVKYTEKEGITCQINSLRISKSDGIYCGGTVPDAYLFKYDKKSDIFENLSIPVSSSNQFIVNDLDIDSKQTIWLGTNEGLFAYSNEGIKKVALNQLHSNDAIKAIVCDNKGFWVANSYEVLRYMENHVFFFNKSSGLPANTISLRNLFLDNFNRVWVGTAKGAAYSYFSDQHYKKTSTPVLISFLVNGENKLLHHKSELKISHNSYIEAEFVSLSFPSDMLKYQYRLYGHDTAWSTPSDERKLVLPSLSKGKYQLQIRALLTGSNSIWSDALVISILVQPAWYTTSWAILLFILSGGFILYFFARIYSRKLERDKLRLEKTVAIRTTEVNKQKEILEIQNDQIKTQNQSIMSSIRYAETIQSAILPNKEQFEVFFQSLIIYLPKDIVSGDFYWFQHIEKPTKKDTISCLAAVVDCTGHGVPGAFMSMIGSRLLTEIVSIQQIIQPSQILNLLDKEIRLALRQHATDNHDGMDVCLVLIEKSTQDNSLQITFSGAKRPLFIFRHELNEIELIKSSRKCIGGVKSKHNHEQFTDIQLNILPNDILYLTTDGIVDLPNKERVRFGTTRFIEMLTQIGSLPLKEQEEIIQSKIYSYQKNEDQRDDITILALKM